MPNSAVAENRKLLDYQRRKALEEQQAKMSNEIKELHRRVLAAVNGLEELLEMTRTPMVSSRELAAKILMITEEIGRKNGGAKKPVLHAEHHQ